MESFDMELKTYYNKVKNEVQTENQAYIKSHPEIRDILNDFISTLLLEKPQDVFNYAQKYFSFFNKTKEVESFQPLIICGPSGAGKGTVVKELLSRFPNIFKLSVSATTRKPRKGEEDGREYIFLTHEKFEEYIEQGKFIEYCKVFNNYYGTLKSQISDCMQQGKVIIIEIDIQGAKKISKHYNGSNYLFINIPSIEILEQRLRDRQTETEEQIQIRLKNAQNEIDQILQTRMFNEVVNQNIQDTIETTIKYLKQQYNTIQFD